MLHLVFDHIVADDLVTPNLKEPGSADSLDAPYINYPEIINFLCYFNIPHKVTTTELSSKDSFYPISIFYFNFMFDYIGCINNNVLELVRKYNLKLLFIYGEPDHPYQIQIRLHDLCRLHNIPFSQVYFISGNTVADNLTNFLYFNEDLALHFYRNKDAEYPAITSNYKDKKFTLLCRTKKNWRTDFVFSVWNEGLHKDAYLSHGDVGIMNQDEEPMDFGVTLSQKFIDACPIVADTLTATEHNDHTKTVYDFFTNSYFNIVLETLIDCEDTNGVFITEKTWKAIRNGQMFVIVGCAGSLKHLSELGFKTFNEVIDESYDKERDVFKRWNMCLDLTKEIANMSFDQLHEIYTQAIPILEHNQKQFQKIQETTLLQLDKKLTT